LSVETRMVREDRMREAIPPLVAHVPLFPAQPHLGQSNVRPVAIRVRSMNGHSCCALQQAQPTHGRRKLAGWHQTSRAALAGIIQISLRNRESWTSSAVGFGSQSPSLTASPKRPLRSSACAASGSGPSSDLCTHERTTSARMPRIYASTTQGGSRSEHRTERKGTARKGTRGRAMACARC